MTGRSEWVFKAAAFLYAAWVLSAPPPVRGSPVAMPFPTMPHRKDENLSSGWLPFALYELKQAALLPMWFAAELRFHTTNALTLGCEPLSALMGNWVDCGMVTASPLGYIFLVSDRGALQVLYDEKLDEEDARALGFRLRAYAEGRVPPEVADLKGTDA